VTREPIIENGRRTGHRVTTEAIYITVRDNRGYESIIMIRARETVVEPLARQGGMFENELDQQA
jgi:hypothetical protein